MTGSTRPAEKLGRKRQAEQDRENWTCRTGLSEQDFQEDRTNRIGLLRQDCQDRTALWGCPERAVRTRLIG
jgi:hypothetical protein